MKTSLTKRQTEIKKFGQQAQDLLKQGRCKEAMDLYRREVQPLLDAQHQESQKFLSSLNK